jgi:hypothetical protein
MLGMNRSEIDQELFVQFAAERIALFLGIVKELYPKDWQKGNQGYLRTNNGISGLLIVFREILLHFFHQSLSSRKSPVYMKANTSEFRNELSRLLIPAIAFLKANPNRSREFRRRSGQSGQDESAQILLEKIQESDPNFYTPSILVPSIETPEKENVSSETLKELIKTTEILVRNFILTELKELYGAAWYRQGIPGNVKKFISARMEELATDYPWKREEINNDMDSWLQYTNLMHLKDILVYNNQWIHFESFFGKRDNFEKYIKEFSDLRNATQHHRNIDPILRDRGRTAIIWIRRCIERSE